MTQLFVTTAPSILRSAKRNKQAVIARITAADKTRGGISQNANKQALWGRGREFDGRAGKAVLGSGGSAPRRRIEWMEEVAGE